ncbi:MAG: LacI family transcriptional regulator [Actinomyces sp.]|nr:LacI family DNA-binding transcriptional regulator [Actinomyces sp.]MCI1787618.1 LacI family transcriptional regulator [Actinomyces sp.]MCI1830174.1 LacI family transcriptional regulator [Actinomyces sp.]MCI1866742.1 LacI family transcriptional regulator [Actinomyces sp.]
MATGDDRPATRSDVARLAGVSTAVVSYVVNDGPRGVSEATRRRVLRAIRQLGYRPNPNARALKVGSTGLVGVVVPEVLNTYYAEFIDAIDTIARSRGSAVLPGITHEDSGLEADLVPFLVDRGVDSLIFICYLQNEELYRLGLPRIPRVLVDRSLPVPGLATVGADFTGGTRIAVSHLADHGHRRIGYIGGPLPAIDLRRQAWDDVLRERELPRTPPAITSWDREGGYNGARILLNSGDPPTAIFAASDLIGVGALRAIRELGLSVPDDVALISFDGTAESTFSWPPLTTVRQPFTEMARQALDTLAHPDGEATHTLFPMSLIVRSSCGCGR